MIKNGKGGGNTKTGLVFEGKTDLATFLNSQEGYRVTALSQILCKRRNAVKTEINILPAAAVNPLSPY